MLTKQQATDAATQEFSKHRQQVSEYAVFVETYKADGNKWIVWFDYKGPFPIPGGKNAVLVDKVSGETVFMPGE